MERTNQFRLYELALELRQIPEYGTGDLHPLIAQSRVQSARKALLPYCSDDNPPLRLTVSLKAAHDLCAELVQLEKRLEMQYFSGKLCEEETDKETVASWWFYDVRRALEKFEAVLSAECETRPAFVAPRRGIYDTEELVNAATNAIPEAIRSAISPKAADELLSAGRCLAFGLFTATGFHICRAVEAVLENYYHAFTGKSGTLHRWHDYIQELEKAQQAGFQPSAEAQTIAYLDQLRDSSRNPIMHPRIVLDETDASIIFDLGRVVICRMAQELLTATKPTRRRKPRLKAVP